MLFNHYRKAVGRFVHSKKNGKFIDASRALECKVSAVKMQLCLSCDDTITIKMFIDFIKWKKTNDRDEKNSMCGSQLYGLTCHQQLMNRREAAFKCVQLQI